MSVDPEEFKRALRGWASGVTVVTSRSGNTMHGMTVSAFSSVSADPPLVLICANRTSTTHRVIEEGGVFGVSILAAHQREVSNVFSAPDNEEVRLDSVTWTMGKTGVPLLDEAAVALECRVTKAYPEGSHTIYVGQVDFVHTSEREPLLYYRGGYRALLCEE